MTTLATLDAHLPAGYLRFDPALQSKTTATPWPHQLSMLDFTLTRERNHALVYSGMGSGKTLFGLMYLEQFSGLRLVLCPKSALAVWRADFAAFYRGEKPFELVVLDRGTSAQKAKQLDALRAAHAQAVVVVNYETASALPLERYGFTAAIADEAHRLGAHDSTRSLTLAKSCAAIPAKVAMTGTPFADGAERVYGAMRWLEPRVEKGRRPYPALFGSWWDFQNAYCELYTRGHIRIVTGYRNLDQLVAKIANFTLFIRTEDVIVNLPEAVTRSYRVPLTPEARAQYKLLADDALIRYAATGERGDAPAEGEQIVSHLLTRLLRCQQLLTSAQLTMDDGTVVNYDMQPRIDALRGVLEELDTDEPVVIFTRFQRDVEVIADLVQAAFKETPLRLTGAVDEHERWQAGEGRILVVNLATGSEGIRLTRARHVIYWALTWSLKQHDQSRARVRRHGQKASTVYFHYILSEDTVDELILDRLLKKKRDVETIEGYLQKETPHA